VSRRSIRFALVAALSLAGAVATSHGAPLSVVADALEPSQASAVR